MTVRPSLAGCALALATAVGSAMAGGAAGSAAVSPALADPDAHGSIGLCAGTDQVTGGSIYTRPFVWKAVATTRPPSHFLGRGENTALLIYAPRPGVDPAEWTGDQLTAASYYQHRLPAAVGTARDSSLADVMKVYPSQQSGLYQLRMQFGKTNYGDYSATYPATTIRVTGSRWSVVDGPTVDCAASIAASNEVLTGLVRPALATPPKNWSSTFTVAGAADSQHQSGKSTGSGAASLPDAAGSADSGSSHTSSPAPALVVVALAALLGLVLAVGLVRRRSASIERTR